MTILIKNIENQLTDRVYFDDDSDWYEDMREATYDVVNTEYSETGEDDYRALKLEFVKYGTQQDFTEPHTWSWSIVYDAYGDNHYLEDITKEDCYHDSGFKDFNECFCDAYNSMIGNLDGIKKVIAHIDKLNKDIIEE